MRRQIVSKLHVSGSRFVLVLVVALMVTGGAAPAIGAAPGVVPGSLVDATADQIGRAAVEWALANGEVATGTPKVALARSVTVDEISRVGLPRVSFDGGETPPLALVIMEGEFDLSGLAAMGAPGGSGRLKYVAYVMDLRAGMPTLIQGSRNGGLFRAALGNPSLPNDGSAGAAVPTGRPRVIAKPLPPPSTVVRSYGAVAAPVAPKPAGALP